jgi:hypothetical protein
MQVVNVKMKNSKFLFIILKHTIAVRRNMQIINSFFNFLLFLIAEKNADRAGRLQKTFYLSSFIFKLFLRRLWSINFSLWVMWLSGWSRTASYDMLPFFVITEDIFITADQYNR